MAFGFNRAWEFDRSNAGWPPCRGATAPIKARKWVELTDTSNRSITAKGILRDA